MNKKIRTVVFGHTGTTGQKLLDYQNYLKGREKSQRGKIGKYFLHRDTHTILFPGAAYVGKKTYDPS